MTENIKFYCNIDLIDFFVVLISYFFIFQIKFICLDVANGYSEIFVEYVRKVRKNFPDHTILVSNLIVFIKFNIHVLICTVL